jgi:uracil-DNA glycosylase family 4
MTLRHFGKLSAGEAQGRLTIEEINRRVVRCVRCPELRTYCAQVAQSKKRAYRDWTYWGKPVPSFGDPNAQVLLVGLAPGAHGSNRTGRPFTGDGSGNFLYPALFRAGFANQPTALARDDGLRLRNCLITAAVRCAPPGNKPTPSELSNCAPYLAEEFAALRRLRVIVALGSIAFRAVLATLKDDSFELRPDRPTFGHAVECTAMRGRRALTVISSFHPSQQNTNTGKLTKPMFDRIFARVNGLLAP